MRVWSDRQHHNVLWPPIQNSKEVSNNFSLQGEIKGGAAHIGTTEEQRPMPIFLSVQEKCLFCCIDCRGGTLLVQYQHFLSQRERKPHKTSVCVYIIAGTDTLFNLEHVNTGTPLHLLLCKTIKAQPHISTNTSSLAIKHTPKAIDCDAPSLL